MIDEWVMKFLPSSQSVDAGYEGFEDDPITLFKVPRCKRIIPLSLGSSCYQRKRCSLLDHVHRTAAESLQRKLCRLFKSISVVHFGLRKVDSKPSGTLFERRRALGGSLQSVRLTGFQGKSYFWASSLQLDIYRSLILATIWTRR